MKLVLCRTVLSFPYSKYLKSHYNTSIVVSGFAVYSIEFLQQPTPDKCNFRECTIDNISNFTWFKA